MATVSLGAGCLTQDLRVGGQDSGGEELAPVGDGAPQGDAAPSGEPGADASIDAALADATPESGPDGSVDAPVVDAPDVVASSDASDATVVVPEAGPDAPEDVGCPSGFTMCGSECVDTRTSALNCGRCGASCEGRAHVRAGAARCMDAQCIVPAGACEAGFENCNSLPGDGCETSLAEPTTCGSCSNSCVLRPSTPLCGPVASMPGRFECTSGCTNPMSPTRCGERCTNTMSDPDNCGRCGAVCPGVVNGTATCAAGACGMQCSPGFHNCAGRCVADNDVASCGSACVPCPAVANGTPTCTATGGAYRCGIACNTGYHLCGSSCVPDNDVNSCGRSCSPCVAPVGGTVSCSPVLGGLLSYQCVQRCNLRGQSPCNNVCVDLSTDNSNCGTCRRLCLTRGGTNTTATCTAGVCVERCNAGYGDANRSATDGCEVACTIASRPSYGDCDGNTVNGCETSLMTTSNCGMCGRTCACSCVATMTAYACGSSSCL